jgi:hypothetical protein
LAGLFTVLLVLSTDRLFTVEMYLVEDPATDSVEGYLYSWYCLQKDLRSVRRSLGEMHSHAKVGEIWGRKGERGLSLLHFDTIFMMILTFFFEFYLQQGST